MNDFSKRIPEVHSHTFIAEGARLIGHVVLKEGASVWYNSVLRADIEDIIIGEDTNVQDNCVIHVDHGKKTEVGRGVTIGHGAVLHACAVGDNCLVGMGAVLLDGCVVPPDSVVAAGSIVPPGKIYPAGWLIMGSPAKIVRNLTDEEINKNKESATAYRRFWEEYVKSGIGHIIK